MSNVVGQSSREPRIIFSPPRLHWTVVLTLSVMTRLLFGQIWLAVQANWIKKVTGRKRVFKWSIVNLCLLPAVLLLLVFLPQLIVGYLGMPRRYVAQSESQMLIGYFGTLLFSGVTGYLIAAAISIVTAFIVRSELQSNRIGLRLSGLMTLFFGPIYFQYILEDQSTSDSLPQIEPRSVPPTSPQSLP